MITIEEKEKIISLASEYKKQVKEISILKEQLELVKKEIDENLSKLNKSRISEMELLESLKDKYEMNDNQVVELVQKIVINNANNGEIKSQ